MAGKEFKDRLKDHRLALAKKRGKDVRPADMARAMGITRGAYGHWESGRSQPKDTYTAEKLAGVLEVDPSALGLDLASLPLRKPPTKGERGKEKDFKPKKSAQPKKAQGE